MYDGVFLVCSISTTSTPEQILIDTRAGTGWISSMFVTDLLVTRPGAPAKHTFAAVGSSSLEKGNAFVEKLLEKAPGHSRPQVYADYQGVYDDPNIDVVYVGTPHALHKKNCLDAIAAGKHVLCEKPFTINAKEAREIVDAARKKGVYVMEGRPNLFNQTGFFN